LSKGLDVVGITDHNSAENVGAVMKAAQGTRLKILPGMEASSSEEVHLVALFDNAREALLLQQTVYDNLLGYNDEEVFGLQVVVNADSEVLGFNPRLLIGATQLSVSQIVKTVHSLNGLVIAAHVDRQSFGILGQLGFIPEGLPLDALELSSRVGCPEVLEGSRELVGYPLIHSSDAHSVRDIGSASTELRLEKPTTSEIRKAFEGREGRQVLGPFGMVSGGI
jgi:PHP family Zn ribbon phosphoesterase